ncbi:MAG: hypothetical protein R3C61_07920 [Bacteroidia bacterium]
MEIRTFVRDEMIIEEKPFMKQMLYLSLALAGISLWIGSVKEYGILAWYRTFYIAGIVMFIAGIVGILISATIRIRLDKKTGLLTISKTRGTSTIITCEIPLEEIRSVELETLTKGDKQLYRVVVMGSGTTGIPLSERADTDFGTMDQVVKMVRRFLGK